MRTVFLLLFSIAPLLAGPAETVQKLFDCMARHDAKEARELFIPGTNLTLVGADGKTTVIVLEKWLERMSSSKQEWKERMWDPTVLEHNSLAVVWASYDFHLDGKLTHCGIDTANLVKIDGDWKISGLYFTHETRGCEIH